MAPQSNTKQQIPERQNDAPCELLPLSVILVAGVDIHIGIEGLRQLLMNHSAVHGSFALWLFVGVGLLRLNWRARVLALWAGGGFLMAIACSLSFAVWALAVGPGFPEWQRPSTLGFLWRIVAVSWLLGQALVLTRERIAALFWRA